MTPAADNPPDANLSWTAEEHRRAGREVMDWIATYLTTLREAPVFQPVPSEAAAAMLASAVPEQGESIHAILERF